jgi:GNAT superfamily N-acetyltransferase
VDQFLAAVKPVKGKDILVGYICATLTSSASLTHESMAEHDPQGNLLCIHSVCVDKSYRGGGIAKRMLAAYLLFVQQTSPQVRLYTSYFPGFRSLDPLFRFMLFIFYVTFIHLNYLILDFL